MKKIGFKKIILRGMKELTKKSAAIILFWSAFFVLSFIAILDMAFDFRKISFRRDK